MPRIMAHDPISAASTQPMNAPSRDAKQIAWGDVGARQEADLAELADWVEGLRGGTPRTRPRQQDASRSVGCYLLRGL